MGNTPSVPYIKEQASAYKHKTTEELALLCSFVVRSAALLFIMCTWELNRTTFLTPDQGVRFRLWLSHASGTCTKTCISLFFFLVYTNVKYFMNQLSVTTTSRSWPVGVFFLPSSPSRGSPGEQASLATCFDGQEIEVLLNEGNWKLLAHGLFSKYKLAASVTACIYSAFPLA